MTRIIIGASALLFAFSALTACENFTDKSDTDTGGATSGGTSSGGSGGSGTSSGSGTSGSSGSGTSSGGSGTSGGTSMTSEIDCDNPPSSPAPDSSSCVTQTLSCGESLEGHVSGGDSRVSGADYASSWACAPVATSTYAGTERMFEFEHPGTGGNATIRLESPCGDLDLFTAHWEDTSDCLRSGVSVGECDASTSTGQVDEVTIWNSSPRRYIVVVENIDGEEHPFSLSASCE